MLGDSLWINSIGLGCMGITHAFGTPLSIKEGMKVISEAYDMGYDFFDMAECYTGIYPDGSPADNEEIVGKALHSVRDKVLIATNLGNLPSKWRCGQPHYAGFLYLHPYVDVINHGTCF